MRRKTLRLVAPALLGCALGLTTTTPVSASPRSTMHGWLVTAESVFTTYAHHYQRAEVAVATGKIQSLANICISFQNIGASGVTIWSSNVVVRDCVIQWIGGGNNGLHFPVVKNFSY